jgi:hypothetical protein
MIYIIAANAILILHLGFVCFVVLGGLLILKWRRLIFLHLPAAVWGALIEYRGWICPLTPLEQHLRQAGDQAGYSGGFVEHYLLTLLYPDYLDRKMQLILGTFVVAVNLVVYSWIFKRWRRARQADTANRKTS